MKVGLIALKGTLIRDPQLLNAVDKYPAFKRRLEVVSSLPSLALLTVGGVIGETADKEYVELKESKCEKLPGPFDLVAISSYSARIDEAYELADRFKSQKTPVVRGGTHVSVLPDETEHHH